jgi:hypothetical protein
MKYTTFADAYKMVINQKEWNLKIGNNTIGNIKVYDDKIIIIFQQTVGTGDWIKNFMAWPFMIRKPYKRMRVKWLVHWGFFKDYKAVHHEIIDIIAKNEYKPILIIGYSRGAPLATYCAEDISYNFGHYNELECITFGGARCVNKVGQVVIMNRVPAHSTIVCGNDIVTKLPFWFVKPQIVYQCGPKRKWWKFSFKDHDGYKELEMLK